MTSLPLSIAVTGGSGFLGSAIAIEAARRGHRVLALDTRPGASVNGVTRVDADIQDALTLRDLFTLHRVVAVVHAAAIAGVDAVLSNLVTATSVNLVGSVTVLTVAEQVGVTRFIDLSSEEVYGESDDDALKEDSPLLPVTAYGVHKLSTELLAREFAAVHYAAARLSWVYGAGFPRTRPPQQWLYDACAGRTSAAGPGFHHSADLIHVDDAVGGILALIEAGRLSHHAYNVGSGRGVAMGVVVDLIRGIQPSWNVHLYPGLLPGIAQRPALSMERIRDELGWTPDLSLEEGLRRTLLSC